MEKQREKQNSNKVKIIIYKEIEYSNLSYNTLIKSEYHLNYQSEMKTISVFLVVSSSQESYNN